MGAFLTSLSGQELFLLFLMALALYARDLPDAAARLKDDMARLWRNLLP